MRQSFNIAIPGKIKSLQTEADEAAAVQKDATYEDGFSSGYQAGSWLSELECKLNREGLRDKVFEVIGQLEQIQQELLNTASEHLPDLLEISLQRLIDKHGVPRESIHDEVQSLVGQLSESRKIVLHCAQEEHESWKGILEETGVQLEETRLTIEPSESLKPGEYLIVSDLGTVDGRHLARMNEFREGISGTCTK